MADGRLNGARVLVVGASSGIGRGIATKLVAEGARVAASGRRETALDELASELDGAAVALRGDVCDPEDCAGVVDRAVDVLGGLDAFVYAAGVSRLAPLVRADAELWNEVLATNVVGASLVCRAAIGHLRSSGGRAVFLGSSSVGRPFPGLAAYAASKAALDELVRGWRAENPDVSFTNVVVGPTVGTEFTSSWDAELSAEMFPFWERHGYLTEAAAMEVSDVGDIVTAVLCSKASMWTVAAYGCDQSAQPAIH